MIPLAHYMLAMRYGTTVTIEDFGNSTDWGSIPGNLTCQSAMNSPAVMQATLRSHYGNTAAVVINSAIPGSRMSQMLAGTDNDPLYANAAGLTFEQRIAASSAVIVNIEHAINDNTEGVSLPDYYDQLSAGVDIILDAGKIPMLSTPYPGTPYGTYGTPTIFNQLKYFASAMRELAARRQVLLVDNYAWVEKSVAKGVIFYGDGKHPPEVCYAEFGKNKALAIINYQGVRQ